LVLFHGLEGSSNSQYAHAFAAAASEQSWAMVVPHFRGCSGEINLAPRAYHSGDYEEIHWILARLSAQHDGSIHAVGISLGGNALLRWAEESGGEAHNLVNSVTAVCSPIDLAASGFAMGVGASRWLYTPMFLHTMKAKACAKLKQYPGLFYQKRLLSARTLYEFDNVFTAPLHGYKDTDDYWCRASAAPKLNCIRVPTLIINATNDPFVPKDSLPLPGHLSTNVEVWRPRLGGHCGFASGAFPANVLSLPREVLRWITTHHSQSNQ
jgi:predicted alpha/beta-fold hydrolase